MTREDMADLDNDVAALASPGRLEVRASRFNAAQTRHYFRICQMYSSARTPIARNSMRRLYKAAGVATPSWIAPELDERIEGPLAQSLMLRRPVHQVSPLLRRQA